MLAGVSVPSTAIIDRAMEYARTDCEPYLFNHVMRSWLFAVRIGQLRGIEHDGEVVALGTLLHDITLNERFAGPRRFEVEAADLARGFAVDAGLDRRRAQMIWDAVALNSTPSIGLYKEAEMKAIVAEFPRLGMKKKMTGCFCHIARTRPETTYDNFVRDFGERLVPGYAVATSSVDLVAQAPFEE
jgi:hypothetical protein